ncbi:MAG TPA: tetratricopeptide repeat protein, partial [Syntrophales bacterium]|nr:tetratricopeptide repeat protein [Syntrophales bacterium]
MKIKIIIVAFILCFSTVVAHGAVSLQDITARADHAYRSGNYDAAAGYYQIVLAMMETKRMQESEAFGYLRYRLGQVRMRQGKYTEAIGNLEAYYRLKPDRAPVAYHYATALFFAGKYQESIPLFEKALSLDGSRGSKARYYLGMAKYLSGNPGEGIGDLGKVRETAPQSAEGKSADRILATLEGAFGEIFGMERQAAVTAVTGRPTKEKPWAVSLSLGMEYDSNVGLIPAEQTRPEDVSSTTDWRTVYSLSGVYEFVNTGRHFAGVNIGAYGTTQMKNNEFNVESGILSLYYKTNLADRFQFRITPFISKTLLNVASHNWSWGATPGVSYQPAEWTWTDLNYTYAKAEFTDAPQYAEENRSGKNHTVVLKQNFSFPSLLLDKRNTYFGAWLFYGKSDTDGASYVNYNNGAGVQAQQEFPLDFTVLLSYVYGKTRYENANIRSVTGEKRDDSSHTLTANVFKKLDMLLKNLSAYAGYRWFKNDSNIG